MQIVYILKSIILIKLLSEIFRIKYFKLYKRVIK